MHVVQVVESFGSGTFEVVKQIAQACQDHGWRTTIFHGNRSETPIKYKALFPENTLFFPLRTGRAINGVIDLLEALRIARYVRSRRISGIHGHSSKGGALARLAGAVAKVPAIYTPHGFSFLLDGEISRRKPTFWVEKSLALLPATIVCCSASEAAVARVLSRRVAFVPNFIALDEVEKAASVNRADLRACDVVTVGRISAQKNITLFIEVARLLPNLRFRWIGGPLEGAASPIPDNVEITGWVDRMEAIALMNKAQVYLSTSRFEGLPIAMLEAQVLRIPVVTTDVPGSRDVVNDGVNGILANSALELAAAVDRLAGDRELRGLMGESGRRVVVDHHDARTNLAQWTNIYADCFAPARRG